VYQRVPNHCRELRQRQKGDAIACCVCHVKRLFAKHPDGDVMGAQLEFMAPIAIGTDP
jgi:hypothetical protein